MSVSTNAHDDLPLDPTPAEKSDFELLPDPIDEVQEILHEMCFQHVTATAGAIERFRDVCEQRPDVLSVEFGTLVLQSLCSLKSQQSVYTGVLIGLLTQNDLYRLIDVDESIPKPRHYCPPKTIRSQNR